MILANCDEHLAESLFQTQSGKKLRMPYETEK
ncbi:MAG: DUF6783 domain-containing protein [Ruminococcus sp.]